MFLWHWEVEKFDTDLGSLRLKASWDFANMTHAERRKCRTAGEYEVPVFYGAK